MPVLIQRNYAPYGVGDPANKYWIHAGSYTCPEHTLESAKRQARRGWPESATYIRNREGRMVWKRAMDGREWEYGE